MGSFTNARGAGTLIPSAQRLVWVLACLNVKARGGLGFRLVLGVLPPVLSSGFCLSTSSVLAGSFRHSRSGSQGPQRPELLTDWLPGASCHGQGVDMTKPTGKMKVMNPQICPRTMSALPREPAGY